MSTIALPHEPFTFASLPSLGWTERDLRRALERGEVRRVLRGVYVASCREDTVQLRTAALRLLVGPHQVVVDRSAAWLHGIDAYAAAELEDGSPIETCALRGHTRSRIAGVRGRTRDLAPGDILELDGVRVTTPVRTALDLGCHLRRREAFASLCGLARTHRIDQRVLLDAAERFSRRRGVLQLRELVPLVDPRLESPREAWTLLAIHDRGLPLPEPQVWVEVDGVPTYRLDLAYPARRVCVEYDGREFHDVTDEQRTRDRVRRGWLREHGWTVIVVRAGDFTGEALERWLGELRAALGSAYSSRRW